VSGLWFAPVALAILILTWYGVQRAWLRCMQRPSDDDALARPGCAGPDGQGCACGAGPPGRSAETGFQHPGQEAPT
jgi:hypothetical protein